MGGLIFCEPWHSGGNAAPDSRRKDAYAVWNHADQPVRVETIAVLARPELADTSFVGLIPVGQQSGLDNDVVAQRTGDDACGIPATAWSSAVVNGFKGTVQSASRKHDPSQWATPATTATQVLHLTSDNSSDSVIPLGADNPIVLMRFEGEVIAPKTGDEVHQPTCRSTRVHHSP